MPETYTTLNYTNLEGRAKVRYFITKGAAYAFATQYLFDAERATASFGTTK